MSNARIRKKYNFSNSIGIVDNEVRISAEFIRISAEFIYVIRVVPVSANQSTVDTIDDEHISTFATNQAILACSRINIIAAIIAT
ncbi:hypothetical protein C5614_24180 [Massilia phosphatilytica]|nr:hypothetical protein C5614_24180 [Massilia phosphatilytica]